MISKREKRVVEARGKVLMEGGPLKHAFTFTYLGYGFRADGKAEHSRSTGHTGQIRAGSFDAIMVSS